MHISADLDTNQVKEAEISLLEGRKMEIFNNIIDTDIEIAVLGNLSLIKHQGLIEY